MEYEMKRLSRAVVPGVIAVALLAGCDVTNPGRVEEEFIATGDAQQALINGAIRMMSEGMGYGSYSAALLAKEIFPAGQIGSYGHDVTIQGGLVDPGDDLGPFDELHQARFIGETAIKRFTEANAPDAMMYQAHLWTGMAYRVLGEWWCEAVISSTDPDDDTPGMHELNTDTYFQRAVDNFTAALGFASTPEEQYAARAGRAQAYLWLEDWANAAADAATVPDIFAFFVPYDDLDQDYFNVLYWAIAYNPYASYTMHFTAAGEHYATTGDPRTAIAENPAEPRAVGSLSGYGPVEFSFPTKYASREDDQRLTSGWEMRLVEAEAILQQNAANYPAAMTLINQVRTRNVSDIDGTTPLPTLTAANSTEAWQHLRRERAIELFLEGRRMGDTRRWDALGTPGAGAWQPPGGYADWQAKSPIFVDEAERAVCFDIPNSERDVNPNVPEVS